MLNSTEFEVSEIHLDDKKLYFRVDGKSYEFELEKISKKHSLATNSDKNDFVLSPSGYGIHWPKIDEDVSISALIKVY